MQDCGCSQSRQSHSSSPRAARLFSSGVSTVVQFFTLVQKRFPRNMKHSALEGRGTGSTKASSQIEIDGAKQAEVETPSSTDSMSEVEVKGRER